MSHKSSPVLRVWLAVGSLFQGNNIIASFDGEQSQIEILQSFWIVGAEIASVAQALLLSHIPSVPWHKSHPISVYWLTLPDELSIGTKNVCVFLSFLQGLFSFLPILCLLKDKVAWLLSEDILFPSLLMTFYF